MFQSEMRLIMEAKCAVNAVAIWI